MAPENLASLVRRADGDALAVGLASLDEPTRRTLGPAAYALYRSIAKGDDPGGEGAFDKIRKLIGGGATGGNESYRRLCTAGLAVLGCGTLTEAKRVRFYDQWKQTDALVKVMVDRRPVWSGAWLDHCLDARDFPWIGWPVARRLIAAGVCPKPAVAGYVREMATALAMRRPREPHVRLGDRLLAEPDLLETEVWRLFEVETSAFAFDWQSRLPKLPADHESWPQALARLGATGALDRQRLLDASLDALWVMDNGTVLGNVCRFHALLAPTVIEEDARAGRYAELLRHRAGAVVGFALPRIAALVGRRRLTLEELLPRLTAVFELKAKSHPLAALKLVALGAKELTGSALLPALGAALRHPSAEVQGSALGLLASGGVPPGSCAAALLRNCLDDLAPVVRARAETVLPPTAGGRAANDEAAWVVGEASALENPPVGEGQLPPPLRFSVLDREQIAGTEAIAPVADVESLIDLAAHLLESVDDAGQVEQLMAGISRLCADRPRDFAMRSAALANRLRQSGNTALSQGIIAWGAPKGFRDLLQAWLQPGLQVPRLPRLQRYCGAVRVLQNRLQELASRVARGVAAPLLAAPTHGGGWVAAGSLVERLACLQNQGLQPMPWDFQQALARLAPDGRKEALTTAVTIAGAAGRVLRFALGADDGLLRGDRGWAPLWVAAARARWPGGNLSTVLAPLAMPTDWPDLTMPARYAWRSEMREVVHPRQTLRYPWVDVIVEPAFPRHALAEEKRFNYYQGLPGLLRAIGDAGRASARGLARIGRQVADAVRCSQWGGPYAFQVVLEHEPLWRSWRLVGYHAPWCIDLLVASQPLRPDPLLAGAVPLLLARIDLEASPAEPNHPFLLALLPNGRPWTDLGRLLLGLALVSRDASVRGVAADVLIAGLTDGRAHPDDLAPVLAQIAAGGWMKRNRLAAALKEVARCSPLHALAVAVLIEGFLLGCESANADDLPLLQLLHEQATILGRPVAAPLRTLLEPLAARSGKSALLAKDLLAAGGGPTQSYREACRLAIATWRSP
jgi:hypothetical protein